MKLIFENWRKHLNEDWQRGEEDKESEDRRAQEIAQKYGLPNEPGLYGAEAVMLSDDNLGIHVRIPSPSGYDRGLDLIFDNAQEFEKMMKGLESLSGNELYQKLFDRWQQDQDAREVPKELIDLLYYDVKDKDETETLEDIERDILSRRQNPTYTSDYDLEGYSAEQIKYAIIQIDKKPQNTNEGTSKKQKAHDAREVDKKAWRKEADAIANDLGWPNRARWDDEKQTYYIQNNDTQERGQDVPQPK